MKKTLSTMLVAILIFCMISCIAYAEGDGNMDGGGGGELGAGSSQSYWNPGNDGCRVTVVDAESGAAISAPMDFTNRTYTGIVKKSAHPSWW